MKKLIISLIIFCMMITLTACGGGSTGNGSEGSTGDSDKVYELSFSMHTAADSTYGEILQDMFDEIEEKTDGHVKINIYGSGTLAAAPDVADMVKGGGADMGWLFTSFYPGQYPLSDVISVPLQGQESSVQGTNVLWDLYEQYPEMAAEWSDYKILQMYANPVSYIYSTKKISTMADLSGTTIRSVSGGVAECLKGWGANVISMPPNEIYDSISKNNIQAYTAEPTMILDFSLQEVTPYVTKIPLYQAPFVVIMNKEAYEELPDEYKAVIDEYGTREASVAFAERVDQFVDECNDTFLAEGGEVIELTDEALKEFQVIADEYAAKWGEMNRSGSFDANKFYESSKESYNTHATK